MRRNSAGRGKLPRDNQRSRGMAGLRWDVKSYLNPSQSISSRNYDQLRLCTIMGQIWHNDWWFIIAHRKPLLEVRIVICYRAHSMLDARCLQRLNERTLAAVQIHAVAPCLVTLSMNKLFRSPTLRVPHAEAAASKGNGLFLKARATPFASSIALRRREERGWPEARSPLRRLIPPAYRPWRSVVFPIIRQGSGCKKKKQKLKFAGGLRRSDTNCVLQREGKSCFVHSWSHRWKLFMISEV
jgi:hypothetical protein